MALHTTAHAFALPETNQGENVSENPRYLRFLYSLIEGEIAWENVGEEDRIAVSELHARIFPSAMATAVSA